MIYYSLNTIAVENIIAKNYSQVVVLCDNNTSKYCFPLLQKQINSDLHLITIQEGELFKSLDACTHIWNQLIVLQADKNTLLINLGGGIVCDIGGFTASVYKRGIAFIHIPTTLLAMVDAAVGGKNGINFLNYKNTIGTITAPQYIVVDPVFLNTLPSRHFLNGYAEMLKHGLIADADYWNSLIKNATITKTIDFAAIQKSIAIKSVIVEQDIDEKGIRKILNFGHTIGHAIESVAMANNYDILHGEAIVEGMLAALYLSKKKIGFKLNEIKKIKAALRQYYTSPNWILLHMQDIIAACKQDKKNNNNQLMFVLLIDMAQPVYNITCTDDDVIEAINLVYMDHK